MDHGDGRGELVLTAAVGLGSAPRRDVAIIGAGPVGLFAAYYAGFRGLSSVVIDSLAEIGGQISAMYPEKLIHDVAGLPGVRGADLVANLVAQAAPYGPAYLLGTEVTGVEDEESGLRLATSSGDVRARALLICAGAGRFRPRPLPAAAGFAGRGLSYFASRPEGYHGKRVVIVGGGDSAVDWALALEPIAASVTVIHRRAAFRAHEASVRTMLSSSVRIATPCAVAEIHGTDAVEAVTIRYEGTQRFERHECDEIVAALGFVADLSLMKAWGINMVANKIEVDERMGAGRPRVYAAGDVATMPGKVRLIAVGLGEAATAVNHLAHDLNPEAPLFPGHSTDLVARASA